MYFDRRVSIFVYFGLIRSKIVSLGGMLSHRRHSLARGIHTWYTNKAKTSISLLKSVYLIKKDYKQQKWYKINSSHHHESQKWSIMHLFIHCWFLCLFCFLPLFTRSLGYHKPHYILFPTSFLLILHHSLYADTP